MQPASEEARDRIADADAADQQRRKADQADELGEPVEPGADATAGIGKAAQPPAGVGIAIAQHLEGRRIGSARCQSQPVLPVKQTARLYQARLHHRCKRRHQARPETGEGIQSAVGLARDQTAHFHGYFSHPQPVADLEVHAPKGGLLDHGAPHAVALGQRVGQGFAVCEFELAVERIGCFDRLELD